MTYATFFVMGEGFSLIINYGVLSRGEVWTRRMMVDISGAREGKPF